MQRRLIWLWLLVGLAIGLPAQAATGRVLKVLPEFLDLKGRNALAPSLYERDAYQVVLRNHPERRSAVRFYVEWKAKGGPGQLKLRAEMRGSATGEVPKPLVLEEMVQPGGWFGRWTTLTVTGEAYKKLGQVVAWRVTLWEGDRLLSEQRSFLW